MSQPGFGNLFYHTASSLQDYLDCPRRFQLRYILGLSWPAAMTGPLLERERLAKLGRRFHQMIQRYMAGLPPEAIASSAADPDLGAWWMNYLKLPPPDLPAAVRRAEVTFVTRLAPLPSQGRAQANLLAARYDLLALEPGRRAVIVDWKTGRDKPSRGQLASRMQTRVYRCALVESGAALNGGRALEPEQITLVYWFALRPAEPVVLPYNAMQYGADVAYLSRVIADIVANAGPVWPSSSDAKRCPACNYVSFCGHATSGSADDLEIDPIEDWI